MNLEQIKAHPSNPFKDFQADDLALLMLELYWAELFREIVGPSAAVWEPMAPADREDANPILELINRSVEPHRAVRIVQRFNTEGLPALDLDRPAPLRFRGEAYVAFVPDLTAEATDMDGQTPLQELLISSDISPACERLCGVLLKRWCADLVDEPAMRELIDNFWGRVRANLIEVP